MSDNAQLLALIVILLVTVIAAYVLLYAEFGDASGTIIPVILMFFGSVVSVLGGALGVSKLNGDKSNDRPSRGKDGKFSKKDS